jgi:hypothetical protein
MVDPVPNWSHHLTEQHVLTANKYAAHHFSHPSGTFCLLFADGQMHDKALVVGFSSFCFANNVPH